MDALYPLIGSERDAWITAQRPAQPSRTSLDPWKPYAFLHEQEPAADGAIASVATIFLTNRECPWRCVMCDLWKNTLEQTVPLGAIPAQLDYALAQLPPAGVIKLYNSGSFFDPRAIPPEDYHAIAQRLQGFDRVIVECHPSLLGDRCLVFRDLLHGKLEVAMGLETAHPQVLEKLNKRMTLDQFAAAADFLRGHNIDLRVFILVQPPFIDPDESVYWAERSLDFASNCGATAASLIPTRAGNGAMEALAATGDFTSPQLAKVEAAMHYGLSLKRSGAIPLRTFVDLWDLRNSQGCSACCTARIDRLHAMNLQQAVLAPISCPQCGGAS